MKELIEKFTGKSQMDVTNVKDMNSQDTNEWEENIAYQKIDEMVGDHIVRIFSRPKEMYFSSYNMDKDIKQAQIFYEYKGQIVRYEIYLNLEDSSKGITGEDLKVDEYILEIENKKIKIKEYDIPEEDMNRWTVSYENKGIYYQLKGRMDKKDIEIIVKNLKFL